MAKVLVVDDEEMLRLCVREILNAKGHQVIEAKDGLEAFEIYQKMRIEISLVLMDVRMPRLDGFDATIKIKGIDPDAKVVLMSGHTNPIPEDVNHVDFIVKPFRARELLSVIQKVLGDQSSASSTPP